MSEDIQNENDSFTSIPQLSKEEVLNILKDENPIAANKDKYSQLILIVETKKVKDNLGIIKGEYYVNGTLDYKGSSLFPLFNISNQSVWNQLKIGENAYYGFTFDSREMKIPEKVIGFFNRSFEGATIQDFIPGCGKRSE